MFSTDLRTLQRWRVLKLWNKDEEREAFPLYLSGFFCFFFCFFVFSLTNRSYRRHFTVLGRRKFQASGWQKTVDHFIFVFPHYLSKVVKKKNKLVFYLHSCYFIPNSPFLKWENYWSFGTIGTIGELLERTIGTIGELLQLKILS